MSEKIPNDASARQFLPIITRISTDVYERVDKVSFKIEELKNTLLKITKSFNDNMTRISNDVEEMVTETRMNRELTLEAFADSINALIEQIQEMKTESINFIATSYNLATYDFTNN